MANGRDKRRLAAILAADVVGYSRLMGVDESGTRAALRAVHGKGADRHIAEHAGALPGACPRPTGRALSRHSDAQSPGREPDPPRR